LLSPLVALEDLTHEVSAMLANANDVVKDHGAGPAREHLPLEIQ